MIIKSNIPTMTNTKIRTVMLIVQQHLKLPLQLQSLSSLVGINYINSRSIQNNNFCRQQQRFHNICCCRDYRMNRWKYYPQQRQSFMLSSSTTTTNTVTSGAAEANPPLTSSSSPHPIMNNNSSIMNPGGDVHIGIVIPNSTYIPTIYETTIGNVWQPSTYKRDTLIELKTELMNLQIQKDKKEMENDNDINIDGITSTTTTTNKLDMTLDDLATEREKLDLYLMDGIHCIIQHVENGITTTATNTAPSIKQQEQNQSLTSSKIVLQDIIQRLNDKVHNEITTTIMNTNNTANNFNNNNYETTTTATTTVMVNELQYSTILGWLQLLIERTLKEQQQKQHQRNSINETTTTTTTTTVDTNNLFHMYAPIRDYMNVVLSTSSSSSTIPDTTGTNNTGTSSSTANNTTPSSTTATTTTTTPDTKHTKYIQELVQSPDFIHFVQQQQQATNNSGSTTTANETDSTTTTTTNTGFPLYQHPYQQNMNETILRYQLYLSLGIVIQLQKSWKLLTTITDQDMDRNAAAIATGNNISSEKDTNNNNNLSLTSSSTALSINKLLHVLHTYLQQDSTSVVRMNALWDLIDKDNDGMIDQIEMNHVCNILIDATQCTIQQFVQEVIDHIPIDQYMMITTNPPTDDIDGSNNKKDTSTKKKNKNLTWRQRRRINNEKKALMKVVKKALKNHFDNELELSHRLRCIYTWANKKHQNNKIDSILVDDSSASGNAIITNVVGRKRYVELYPKITIDEFYEVQSIHLPQIHMIGQEYIKAIRDDLLIIQGKRRQNYELQRDCAIFFFGVCIVDFIILSL